MDAARKKFIEADISNTAKVALVFLVAASMFFALSTTSARAAAFEPNDNVGQAYGPLVGGLPIAGSIDTANDVDYFYFYTSGQTQFHIEFKNSSAAFNCLQFQFLRGDNAERITGDHFYDGSVFSYNYTAPGARKYFLQVGGDGWCESYIGDYEITLSPAEALTTTPPGPALAPECVVANARVDVATQRLSKAVRKYKQARSRKKKRSRARKVRIARASLKRAIQNANSECAVPAQY